MRPNDEMAGFPAGGAAAAPSPPSSTRARWGRRTLLAAPLIGFAALVATFAARLGSDPNVVPSPLIGEPVPEFNLPPLKGRLLGLASANLRGEVSLVNVFASWCVACREEHPVLMRRKRDGIVAIHGLDYKDRPDDAA